MFPVAKLNKIRRRKSLFGERILPRLPKETLEVERTIRFHVLVSDRATSARPVASHFQSSLSPGLWVRP